jgi:FOG: HEAT repeat
MITHRRMMAFSFILAFILFFILVFRIDAWLVSPGQSAGMHFLILIHTLCEGFISQSVDLRQESGSIFRFLFPYVIVLAILSSLSIVLLFFTVVNMRLFSKYRAKRRKDYTDEAQRYILHYIDNADEIAVAALRELPPKIVTVQIFLLYRSIMGKKARQLKKLFYELDCDKYVLKKSGSIFWSNRLRYLPIASAMQITSAKEYARQTIDCYMPLVRNEAEMAFFYLDKYHSLDFLKNFNRVLSEWHQLHIYNLIVRKSIPPPDFSVFYTEKNDSVVAFALQMTRLFRQQNNAHLVIPYLHHKKEFVRKQAILTLRDFEMNDAIPDLIDIYGKEESRLKIEIIRTLAFLSTNEAIEFLVNEMANPDKMIRIEIIQSLDHHHRSQLLDTIDNFDGLEEIVKHISDGHIL